MQQFDEVPTEQMSSSVTYASIEPSQPDIVYGEIVPSQEPDLGNHQLYANVPSNSEADGAVLYSELQSKNNDSHTAAPSGDLYAQVQKR